MNTKKKLKVTEIFDQVNSLYTGGIDERHFLKSLDMVHNEVSSDYIPIIVEETVRVPIKGRIDYSSLSNQAFRILSIESDDGETSYKYTIKPSFMVVYMARGKRVKIAYCVVPNSLEMGSELDYDSDFLKAFVYGVCSELYLFDGEFSKSSVFNNKYKKEVFRLHMLKGPVHRDEE